MDNDILDVLYREERVAPQLPEMRCSTPIRVRSVHRHHGDVDRPRKIVGYVQFRKR